ncbi:MAG: hypothetical protein MJZ74_04810 [Muribaculaceae bacterium]|nr:hypothetical protein [Muribaculaceae bacterium]
MKYTCPKCGKTMEFSVEQLTDAQYKVTCPQCGCALEIVGDYAYVPLEDGSLDLSDTPKEDPEPKPQRDPLYQAAVDYVVTCNAITPVMLAQYFDIPIERANEIMRQLEEAGVVGPANGGAPRTILIPHNTNLPGAFMRHFDPDAANTPPTFKYGNFKGKTYTINCSGCLFILILISIIAMFLK